MKKFLYITSLTAVGAQNVLVIKVCLTWMCCSLLVGWGGLTRVKWSLGVTHVSRLSSWVEARLVAA